LALPVLLAATLLAGVGLGSVAVAPGDALAAIWHALTGQDQPDRVTAAIIVGTRLPRVLCAALVGGSLAICGAAMQGLLKNPLADGTTLGVSSGASLGAVLALALGWTIPGLPSGGVMLMAMVFAGASLLLILGLAYKLDATLSTNTIILLGIIFTMFASSAVSLVVTYASDRLRSITFWLMGSLAGLGYRDAAILAAALAVAGCVLLAHARELNAFAIGEDNARHVGVNVRRVKFTVLIASSALIGVCVAMSGVIGFVGLVTPHMMRFLTGPDHSRLLPASVLGGAIFLTLGDIVARTIVSPRELPIGVVTSLIGAVFFLAIFYSARRRSA
jgi:iron complex transport system permease protein